MAIDGKVLARHGIGLALASVALYYALWGGEYSAFDLGRLSDQRRTEAAVLAQTRTEVDSLNVLVEQLESDPATIERVARERFGMIREGETLFRFVDVDPAAPADPAT